MCDNDWIANVYLFVMSLTELMRAMDNVECTRSQIITGANIIVRNMGSQFKIELRLFTVLIYFIEI